MKIFFGLPLRCLRPVFSLLGVRSRTRPKILPLDPHEEAVLDHLRARRARSALARSTGGSRD